MPARQTPTFLLIAAPEKHEREPVLVTSGSASSQSPPAHPVPVPYPSPSPSVQFGQTTTQRPVRHWNAPHGGATPETQS